MSREKITRLLLLALPLAAAAHMAYYYPLLPDRVPSHFGPSGYADGWMSKPAFAGLYLGMVTLFSVLMGGIGALIRALPAEAINLPNRDYWLAPKRRDATFARISAQMNVFGVVLDLYLMAVMHLSFQAALGSRERLDLPLFLALFIGFLGFVGFWLMGIFRNFRLPG